MFMLLKDEEKRSKLWRIVVIVSSLLIIFIIIYFMLRARVINPLKGLWHSDIQGYTLTLNKDYTAVLEGEFEGECLKLEFQYELDRPNRIVTFKVSENAYAEAVKASKNGMKAGELKGLIDAFFASYDYSITRGKLTLIEREYAEQFEFSRVKK